MSEEKVVEHHWHDPTLGQVTKAMYQYLQDQGIDRKYMEGVIENKVQSILAGKIDTWVNSGRFDTLITDAVAQYVLGEKKAYEANKYGFHNRLRYLIEEHLKTLLIANYDITVTPKEKQP